MDVQAAFDDARTRPIDGCFHDDVPILSGGAGVIGEAWPCGEAMSPFRRSLGGRGTGTRRCEFEPLHGRDRRHVRCRRQ